MADSDPYFLPEEPSNPYAPPEASLRSDLPTFYGQDRLEPFSPGAAVSRAWRIFKANPGLILGVVWSVQVVSFLYQLVGSGINAAVATQAPGPVVEGLLTFSIAIIGLVIQLWLAVGQTLVLVNAAYERPTSLNDIVSGGPFFWPYVWGTILYVLVIAGLAVAIFLPLGLIVGLVGFDPKNPSGAGVIVIAVGGLIAFVGLIYLSLRLYLYQFLIVDRGMSGSQALSASYQITKGHEMNLLGTGLLAGLIGLSGILACGVGLLVTVPLAAFIFSCAYVLIASEAWGTQGSNDKLEPELLL